MNSEKLGKYAVAYEELNAKDECVLRYYKRRK